MNDLNISQIRSIQMANRQDLVQMVSNALRTKEGCRNTLSGEDIPFGPPADATSPQQISAIRDAAHLIVISAIGGPAAPIVGNFPDNHNQSSLRNIRFQLWVPDPSTPLAANVPRQGWLRTSFDLLQGDGTARFNFKDTPLTIVPDSALKVANCYASGTDEFCAALGGAYDPITNLCNHIDLTASTFANIFNTVEVRGGIKIGNDTSTCTSSNAGTLRYTDTNGLEYCNGNASQWWRVYPRTTTVEGPTQLCESLVCTESVAQCPSGYTVTGGGGNLVAPSLNTSACGGGSYMFMLRSYPSSSSSWAALGNCSYYKAYAICAEQR